MLLTILFIGVSIGDPGACLTCVLRQCKKKDDDI